jgi:adhesin/invasin
MRMRLRFLCAIALGAVASCGADSSTSPTNSSPGNGSTSTNGVNIAVDSAFAIRPAVVGSSLLAKVRITLNGVPVVGEAVTWTPASRSGTVSTATTPSDSAGYATTTWVVGDTAGTQTLTASIIGASANLVAQASAGAATTLTKVTADSSAVVAGGSLLLTVRTADKFGNVVAGVPVTWSSSAGAVSVGTTTTGATGQAEVAFTTPTTPGLWTVTASVAGFGTATFKVLGM